MSRGVASQLDMTTKGTTGINPLIKIIGILIIISVLLPSTRIVFSFKPDLPLVLAAAVLLMLEKKVARLPVLVHMKVLAALIFISMLLSDNIGNFSLGLLGKLFVVPTEFMQVLSRFLVFYLFTYIGYFNVIDAKLFHKTVSGVFLVALIWGMLQVTDIGIVNAISLKYAMSDLQMNVLQSSNTRIFGTAGNAITWGGISVLMFYYFFFLGKGLNPIFRNIAIVLSIFNVVFCSSRSALFAMAISFLIMQFVIPFYKQRGKRLMLTLGRNLSLTIAGILVVVGAAFVLVPERVAMVVTRIDSTEEDLTEEGRGGQLNFFLDLFEENQLNYIFGIGKPSVDHLSFMEMEPFFLLFAYGVVGVVLHYFMMWLLIRNAGKLRRFDINAYFFVVSTALFFVIFSFGFFFFREVISGLPFWWLSGYLIGTLYKAKHEQKLLTP